MKEPSEDRGAKQLAARVERKYASSGYPEAKRVFLHGDALHSAGLIWTAADYAELGLKDKAFEWLDKAIELRNPNMEFIKVDERFVQVASCDVNKGLRDTRGHKMGTDLWGEPLC